MRISRAKIKVMRVGTQGQDSGLMTVGRKATEVSSFIYVSSVIERDGGTEKDVRARIGKAAAAAVF